MGSSLEDQFESAEFSTSVNDYYIPLRLIESEPNTQDLIRDYNISHIPSMLLLGADGVEIDRIIDLPGKRDQYLQFLINSRSGIDTYGKLLAVYEKNPDNIDGAFKLFKKNVQRGNLEEIIAVGKKILETESASEKSQEQIFKQTRYFIRTILNRSGKEPFLKYFNDFPGIRFSKGGYKLLARNYAKGGYAEGGETDQAKHFFARAFKDYPENIDIKKYFLEYCINTKTQITEGLIIARKLLQQEKNSNSEIEHFIETLNKLTDETLQ